MKSHQQTPKTTVVAIISKFDGGKEHILLTQRKVTPYQGKWCLPGGHIDEDEMAEDAIIREVKEETGLDFFPNFYRYYDEIIPEEKIHAVPLIFTGISKGNLVKDNSEVKDADWVLLEDAFSYDFAFHNKAILQYYRNNHPGGFNENAILVELKYLRDEIVNRFETRNKMIYFTIVLSGIILAFGKIEGYILYPILGTFLAGLWSHSDIRVDDIAEYIKTQIEPKVNDLGWENHLYRKYKAIKIKEAKRQERYVLWVFYSTFIIMLIFSGFSIFQSLEKVIEMQWNVESNVRADILKFTAGIIITIICAIKTRAFITKRRKKYSGRQS